MNKRPGLPGRFAFQGGHDSPIVLQCLVICYEIFREILREARAYQAEGYRVLANQKVVDRLLDEESGNVAELEGFIGRTIRFQVETMYSQEQYDVVLL